MDDGCTGMCLAALTAVSKAEPFPRISGQSSWMSQYSPEEIGFIDKTSKDKRTAFRWNSCARKGVCAWVS